MLSIKNLNSWCGRIPDLRHFIRDLTVSNSAHDGDIAVIDFSHIISGGSREGLLYIGLALSLNAL